MLLGKQWWRRLLGILFFLLCFAWIGVGLDFNRNSGNIFASLAIDLLGGVSFFYVYLLVLEDSQKISWVNLFQKKNQPAIIPLADLITNNPVF
ncbi:MAG: hypothetical protein I3274_07815 [Candidatus Moeniiplasma glomeromycotorum]|nr:hypothetical protein [Candidatus Moeniiplasma glomeromycotorum]